MKGEQRRPCDRGHLESGEERSERYTAKGFSATPRHPTVTLHFVLFPELLYLRRRWSDAEHNRWNRGHVSATNTSITISNVYAGKFDASLRDTGPLYTTHIKRLRFVVVRARRFEHLLDPTESFFTTELWSTQLLVAQRQVVR